MKIDLIIFDLDGTLIDSKPDIAVAVNRALVDFGYAGFDPEAVGKCIGHGIHDLFQKLIGPEVPSDEISQMIETYRQYYREKMSELSRPYSGVPEALEYFAPIKRAVLTNKNQKFADQILHEFNMHHHFDSVYGADAFAKTKPDPLPIQEICRRFKVDPRRAAMVGDSEVDLAAAKGAGCISVIVQYGYGNPEAIEKLRPDFQINRARELCDLFEPNWPT